MKRFITPKLIDKPVIFEVFTDYREESDALRSINTLKEAPATVKSTAKKAVKSILGQKTVNKLKRIVRG